MQAAHNVIRKYLATAIGLTVLMGFAQAQTIQPRAIYAEGVAEIVRGDRNVARQKAIADALNQAALSMEAHVMVTERMDKSDVSLQSQQVRATHPISKYSVVSEWEFEAEYHVVVSAEELPGESAQANSIHAVKRKIAFMQFDAINTVQLDDIRSIYSELPKEISRRLEADGGWVVNYVNGILPRDSDAQQREVIKQVARDTGVQFLISGLILDAGINKMQGVFGSSFLGSKSRHFKVEVTVHDGLTGTRLFTHQVDADAKGEVEVGDDKVFGGGAFFVTASGRALDRLIDAATKDIRATLACLPLSAQVVRVEGKTVYLDAGAISMLKTGDKLVLYTTDIHSSVVTIRGASLGMSEHPATTVTLVKIQPLFSIGELPEDATKLGIKPGNIARFEFSDKRLDSTTCLQ